MKTYLLRHSWLVGAITLSLLSDAAVWAHTTPIPLETTKQVGATAIVYKGPQLDLALSYRFAKQNPTGNWLMLDTVMTAAAAPLEVPRASISVRTPNGDVVPLATQQAFGKAYAGLAASIARANAFREPMGYLLPQRPRRMDYFSEPARRLAFPSIWLDEWHNTYGRLYFELPGGVQKGDYELLISLPESHVTIPFAI
ncbi:MAG: hypothetical protein LAO05_14855 [Acidobacteriia bacterium]|nr:hypothetical protein [Terriglobia bacterium]